MAKICIGRSTQHCNIILDSRSSSGNRSNGMPLRYSADPNLLHVCFASNPFLMNCGGLHVPVVLLGTILQLDLGRLLEFRTVSSSLSLLFPCSRVSSFVSLISTRDQSKMVPYMCEKFRLRRCFRRTEKTPLAYFVPRNGASRARECQQSCSFKFC